MLVWTYEEGSSGTGGCIAASLMHPGFSLVLLLLLLVLILLVLLLLLLLILLLVSGGVGVLQIYDVIYDIEFYDLTIYNL